MFGCELCVLMHTYNREFLLKVSRSIFFELSPLHAEELLGCGVLQGAGAIFCSGIMPTVEAKKEEEEL